jgi:pimeloyl-ACP methyl ester carboxylesterase
MASNRWVKKVFPLWTVVVAVAASVAISGRFAEYKRVFDVEVAGAGPPVILIPGLATTGEVWAATVARYEGRHEVHTLTLAGFGGPEPLGEPFLPRVAEAILDYIEERRLVRPVLVGHSLGGFVALDAASRAPDRIGGVVAVDGVPFLPALADPTATPAAMADQAKAIRTMHGSMTREQFAAQTGLALRAMITAPGDVTRAQRWTEQTDPAAAGIAMAELMTTDLRPALCRVTAPILLIGALGSAPAPMHDTFRAAYRAQMAQAPRATVVFADRARHFVMLDDPAFFHAALDGFLREATAAAATATAAAGR